MISRHSLRVFPLLALFLLFFLAPQIEAQENAPLKIERGEAVFEGKVSEHSFSRSMTISVGGEEYEMRALGSGLRTKWRFKVYEAVLYADRSGDFHAADPAAVARPGVAKRIEMHFLRGVGAEKIRNAWKDGLNKTIDKELEGTLDEERAAFGEYFQDELKKPDVIELTWIPGQGLFTTTGGDSFDPIASPEFSEALFLIWLGEDPISGDLRKDLFRIKE